MRQKALVFLSAAALVFAAVAAPAMATPLALDGSWVVLDETMPVGGFFAGSYDFTSSSNVDFTITDWAVVSDAFNVYDFGVLAFSTPLMPDWNVLGAAGAFTSPPYTSDPDVALASGNFSSAVYTFGAGAHSLTIQDYHIPITAVGAGPFPDGTVAFKATTPEPGTMGLMLLGGVALLALRRKND
ncbi:MAG: PEP-CTERM sorting domain-containing protein [Candidatus Eisenbacteria bacterium]|nr:PEP-CTERM sorting domain-containing protein [Candidatus Eisenbacteria bacterium]